MNRRNLLRALPALGSGSLTFGLISHGRAETSRDPNAFVFASTAALSGPLGAFGANMKRGVEAAFSQLNASGGVHGRRLQFEVLDDAYVPTRSVENAKKLLADDSVLGLIACLGTPNNTAITPLIEQSALAHLAPLTGATSLRRPDLKSLFHVRASYTDEAQRLVQSLVGMGITSIGLVYHDNGYGQEVLRDAQKALADAGIKLAAATALAGDGKNLAAVVTDVLAAKPAAVMLGTAGGVSTGLVQALRKESANLPIASISPGLTTDGIRQLGASARGIAITQVIPDPLRAKSKLVRDFQSAPGVAARAAEGLTTGELEGYINGRIMAEALNRAGRAASREKIRSALSGIRNLDLGGFVIDYNNRPYVASKYVDLGVLSAEGRIRG